MAAPTDSSADLIFNLGGATADVNLANISLVIPAAGDLNLDGNVNYTDLNIFVGNWLKQQTGLTGDFNGDGKVDFTDFQMLGQYWSTGPP